MTPTPVTPPTGPGEPGTPGEPAQPRESASSAASAGATSPAAAGVPAASARERHHITAGTHPAAPSATPGPSATPPPSAPAQSATQANRRGMLLGALSAGAAVVVGAALEGGRHGGTGAAAGSGGVGVGATGAETRVTLTVSGMHFVPDVIEVPAGNRLLITLENTADQVHDLVLANGATTGRVAPGASATLDAGVIAGDMEGWCSVPGHRAMGMVMHVHATTAAAAGEHHEHGQPSGNSPDAVADYSADLPEGFRAVDASLPPAEPGPHMHTFTVTEQVMPVGGGVQQLRMTYNGGVPGPVLRGHVGDSFDIHLVNQGSMSHSIDFHAGITPPNEAMRSIAPGESLDYHFTAAHSGIWLYHCSTAPMSVHLSSGMFGAVIIDPEGLAPVDREFVLIQSEVYLGPEGGETNAAKVSAATPDLMAFNGVAFQYAQQPLQARAGERVRMWVLDAGPTLPCSFHVVGLQFDTVFFEGNYLLGGPQGLGSAWQGGSQALALGPAQGGFVEMTAPEPGHYTFVTHAFAHMEKGAKGVLEVTA